MQLPPGCSVLGIAQPDFTNGPPDTVPLVSFAGASPVLVIVTCRDWLPPTGAVNARLVGVTSSAPSVAVPSSVTVCGEPGAPV